MSDIFGGIFDSLSNTVEGLFDSANIGNAVVQGGKAFFDQPKNGVDIGSLSRDFMSASNGISTPARTRPTESVDPYALERMWQDRLANFAKIERETGTTIKK